MNQGRLLLDYNLAGSVATHKKERRAHAVKYRRMSTI